MHRVSHRLRFGVTSCQIAIEENADNNLPGGWTQLGRVVVNSQKNAGWSHQWWNSQGLRVVSKAAANWTERISTNFPPLQQPCWPMPCFTIVLLYTSHKFVRIWLVYDDIETGLNMDTCTFIMYHYVCYSMIQYVCLFVCFYAHVHLQVFSTWSAELSRRQIAGNAFFGAPSALGGLGQAFFHFQSGPVVGGNPKAERRLWDENEKVIPRDRNKIYTCIICLYTYVY